MASASWNHPATGRALTGGLSMVTTAIGPRLSSLITIVSILSAHGTESVGRYDTRRSDPHSLAASRRHASRRRDRRRGLHRVVDCVRVAEGRPVVARRDL